MPRTAIWLLKLALCLQLVRVGLERCQSPQAACGFYRLMSDHDENGGKGVVSTLNPKPGRAPHYHLVSQGPLEAGSAQGQNAKPQAFPQNKSIRRNKVVAQGARWAVRVEVEAPVLTDSSGQKLLELMPEN